jgi:serine/threonine protein kinase
MVRSSELPPGFMAAYLEQYRKLASLDQRNVVSIYEVGETAGGGYVALEFLPGGQLIGAIRSKLPVGHALNCLAEMCLALDAVHGLGIVHGALRAEHFLFRSDRVLVLADFNVTERVSDSIGLAHPVSSSSQRGRRTHASATPGARLDFRALGGILYAMLTGDVALLPGLDDEWLADRAFEATRLPLPLSPLQPCLDGLLGTGSAQPVERAEDVLVELLALKEVFPFDIPHAEVNGVQPAGRRKSR